MPSKAPAKKRQPLAVTDSNVALHSTAKSLESKKAGDLDVKATAVSETENQAMAPSAKPIKRKASEIEEPQTIDIDSDDERLNYVTDNCDQVRRKIRNLINSGEMKVGEFQRAIDVSPNAYGRFMGQSGKTKGDGSDTYYNAFRFFKKRELAGVKAPKKKKASKAETDKKHDVSDIHLDGEADADADATGGVPVYDTCDEVRKKINAHLRDAGVTQAGFLREIAKTYPDGRKLQAKQLSDFLGKRGAAAGNTSAVFYASYVFFEKLRIRDGKPKSKLRAEMEKIWGAAGFDREARHDRGYWCGPGEVPHVDKYGQVHFRR